MINFRYIIVLLCLMPYYLFGQGGMKFQEFAKRLEPYFDSELISDLEKKLPQGTAYSIWGWDAGDFSGDGYYDVAFTVKLASESKRIAHVYMFVDIDGYLTEVSRMVYDYVELPLEIGIIIKQNACFVTKKHKQFDWEIKGFRFDNGTLMQVDEYDTEKIEHFTHDSYANYLNLQNQDRFVSAQKNDPKVRLNYLTVPSYQRGRQIYKGIASEAIAENVDYVTKGAYYWKGSNDASMSIKSAYDDEYLYLTIKIKDDAFIPQNCEACPSDFLELWFDITQFKSGNRIYKKTGDKLIFRNKNEGASLYNIVIIPGDMLEKKAYIKDIGSTDDLENSQKLAIKKTKALAVLKDDGYIIKCRIPFSLFGYESVPIDEDKLTDIGFTAVYHDIDNEFRPEEETIICTSGFDQKNPSTFGVLSFVPNDKWYGDAENIYIDDILKNLIDEGF